MNFFVNIISFAVASSIAFGYAAILIFAVATFFIPTIIGFCQAVTRAGLIRPPTISTRFRSFFAKVAQSGLGERQT